MIGSEEQIQERIDEAVARDDVAALDKLMKELYRPAVVAPEPVRACSRTQTSDQETPRRGSF